MKKAIPFMIALAGIVILAGALAFDERAVVNFLNSDRVIRWVKWLTS
jgi:hypothetical protein